MQTLAHDTAQVRDDAAEWAALEAERPFYQTMMGKSRQFEGPSFTARPHPAGYRPDLPLESELDSIAKLTKASKAERLQLAARPVTLLLWDHEDRIKAAKGAKHTNARPNYKERPKLEKSAARRLEGIEKRADELALVIVAHPSECPGCKRCPIPEPETAVSYMHGRKP